MSARDLLAVLAPIVLVLGCTTVDLPVAGGGPDAEQRPSPSVAAAAEPPDVGLRAIGGERPPGLVGPYAARWAKEPLEREGGGPGTESAVTAGLRWLARHQAPDGRWSATGWTARCRSEGPCGDSGSAPGEVRGDVGLTALALLAYQGNGHSHVCGVFAKQVRDGLSWLCARQAANGSLGQEDGDGALQDHALAALALVEAYAMTRDPALLGFAEKALAYCVETQDPERGWAFDARTRRADAAVSGWMVQALWAGKQAGLAIPAEAFRAAERWAARTGEPRDHVGCERWSGEHDPVPCLAGLSLFSETLLGVEDQAERGRASLPVLLEHLPRWPEDGATPRVSFYAWYWGTNAVFQASPGHGWAAWSEHLVRALLPAQRWEGCADGSWDPIGEARGRVYATAINALTLEVYYRLTRLKDGGDRPGEVRPQSSGGDEPR